jgi:hypothetical protein
LIIISRGYTAKVADAAAVIPTVSADMVTPHTDIQAFQAVVGHPIVSNPALKRREMKWCERLSGGSSSTRDGLRSSGLAS